MQVVKRKRKLIIRGCNGSIPIFKQCVFKRENLKSVISCICIYLEVPKETLMWIMSNSASFYWNPGLGSPVILRKLDVCISKDNAGDQICF